MVTPILVLAALRFIRWLDCNATLVAMDAKEASRQKRYLMSKLRKPSFAWEPGEAEKWKAAFAKRCEADDARAKELGIVL